MSTITSTSTTTVTSLEPLPPTTFTYWSSYEALYPGPPSSIWTTSMLETTTSPASTRTNIIVVPIPSVIVISTTPSSAGSYTFTATSGSSILTIPTASPTTSSTAAHASPTGHIVTQGSSHKIAAIVAGVLAPVLVILIGATAWYVFFRRRRGSKIAGGRVTNEQWLSKFESGMIQQPSAPLAPLTHIALPDGYYRIGSPPRPDRPKSVSESLLGAISKDTSPRSDAADVDGIELAKVISGKGILNDNDVDYVIPNTDLTPIFDGTRKKYLHTAIERGLPLHKLTRPSLRVANNPSRRSELNRNSYYDPNVPKTDPLRIHKKSVSDDVTSKNGNVQRHYYDFDDEDHPSPAMTEGEFITDVRRGISKTPPLEKATTENELMGDASTECGSYINEHEIAQNRQNSLAQLEGLTPELTSSQSGPRGPRPESIIRRDALGKPIVPRIPPRLRRSIPEKRLERRQAVDGDVVQTWL